MRGICVNLNHNSNPSLLFPSVSSFCSSKRVIRSNQFTNQKPKHKTLQQVMNALFGWKIVIWTNEQRKQSKERFLKKPTCKPKAWVRKSAKWNANFGGRLEIKQNIEKAKRNRGFLNKTNLQDKSEQLKTTTIKQANKNGPVGTGINAEDEGRRAQKQGRDLMVTKVHDISKFPREVKSPEDDESVWRT